MLLGLAIPGVLKSLGAVNHIRDDAKRIAKERLDEPESESAKKLDIFSQFARIVHQKRPGLEFGLDEMVLESWVGIVAGADSVAISLRCVLYQLMKRPDTLQKCVDEISAADASGLLSKPVQYNETTSHLPYTCACIKEAARIFPAFQVHMGRHAPSEGLELCGYYIPAGYRVSMNAGLVQLDPFLFGSDAREFKPERWLQSQERNFAMEKGMLNFGAGTRTCSGRHISLFTILRAMYTFRRVCAKIAQIATVELHKLIPEIIRHFRIAMAHNRGWKTRNAAFIKQKDLIVKVALK